MTETDLRERMRHDVDDIVAPADLVERARRGGARRVRRRIARLAASATAVVAVTGAIAVPALRSHTTNSGVAPASGFGTTTPYQAHVLPSTSPLTPAPWPIVFGDPYRFLLQGNTRGDLARDTKFLGQAVVAWRALTDSPTSTGEDPWPGAPKVYWAGTTPAGKAAIIAQHMTRFDPENGTRSLPVGGGFIGESSTGGLRVSGGIGPVVNGVVSTVLTKRGISVLIVLNSPTAWQGDWSVSGKPLELRPFKDGVSITLLPPGTEPMDLNVKVHPPVRLSIQPK